MNFDISEDQQMMRDTFARFLDKHSSMARVRAAQPRGFDPALWSGLAELGAFSVRVPEASGGLGLGLLDAAILMEEIGRTLASGAVAETLVAARLLAVSGGADTVELLGRVIAGETIVSLAFRDIADEPVQWVAGGAVAEAVIARDGERIVLVTFPESERRAEANLASTAMAELRFAGASRKLLADRRSRNGSC
jgi:alkylation response protein AidB-like acyl-CoA dehydrogenase